MSTSILGHRYPPIYGVHNEDAYKVVDQARGLGLPLDDWQTDILACASTPIAGIVAPRQQGKTYTAMVYAIVHALVDGEIVHYTTESVILARNALYSVERLLLDTPGLKQHIDKVRRAYGGNQAISFHNGGRIVFEARSGHGHRGLTANRIIVDDAKSLTEDVYGSLMIQSAAMQDFQILLLSSAPTPFVPPRRNAIRKYSDPAVVLKKLRARALSADPLLTWMEWSVPNALDAKGKLIIDPFDPAVVAVANPAYGGPRFSPESAAREAQLMPLDYYLVERLGITDWTLPESD